MNLELSKQAVSLCEAELQGNGMQGNGMQGNGIVENFLDELNFDAYLKDFE